MSNYIYRLHVIAVDGVAQQLSVAAFALCRDVGPNNVSQPLNANGDDAEATHFGFSAPVTQAHIDALFGAGLGETPGVLWARTDRGGLLQKRHDSEEPLPEPFTFEDLMGEAGLKRRVALTEI